MTILIPAYKPGQQFLTLLKKIKEKQQYRIVIIDDGSGSAFENIFRIAQSMGCTVLSHESGKGRGRALKTGFEYILQMGEAEGVVCVDFGAMPEAEDIFRVAQRVCESKQQIVLGTRQLPGNTSFFVRLVHSLSNKLISYTTGESILDTQSGVRGFSYDMLDWLCHVPGERLDYEMNMLAEARAAGYSFYEEMLEAAYIGNRFHIQAFRELFRICVPIVRFSVSAVASGLLDFILLLSVHAVTKNLLASVVTARVCSSILNYILNGFFVFNRYDKKSHHQSAPMYFLLSAVILLFNYLLMNFFNHQAGIPLVISKLLTEAILFVFSYWSQRKFVY
jgi:putative flippase GtrA